MTLLEAHARFTSEWALRAECGVNFCASDKCGLGHPGWLTDKSEGGDGRNMREGGKQSWGRPQGRNWEGGKKGEEGGNETIMEGGKKHGWRGREEI